MITELMVPIFIREDERDRHSPVHMVPVRYDYVIDEYSSSDYPLAIRAFNTDQPWHDRGRLHSEYACSQEECFMRFTQVDRWSDGVRKWAEKKIAKTALARINAMTKKELKVKTLKDFAKDHQNALDAEKDRLYEDVIVDMALKATSLPTEILDLATAKAARFVGEILPKVVRIDGMLHEQAMPPVYNVNTRYNNTIHYEIEQRPLTMWSRSLSDLVQPGQGTRGELSDRMFFSIQEEQLMDEFCAGMAEKHGRRDRVFREHGLRLEVLTDQLPYQDMSYAELLRHGRNLAIRAGQEIARRIKNQEHTIFSSERAFWRLFDRLAETLDAEAPFGEPSGRLEPILLAFMTEIEENADRLDEDYRNMASNCRELIDYVRYAIDRHENRPMSIMAVGNALSL